MSKEVAFKVGMTCGGCSSAVTRILKRIDGVEEVECNVETKDVKVTCAESVESSVLLEALEKWSASSKKSVELVS
jgi:copper chaperone